MYSRERSVEGVDIELEFPQSEQAQNGCSDVCRKMCHAVDAGPALLGPDLAPKLAAQS